ncbi:MAG: ornithine carbamoyltransferase [Phycisphaerae bacterium]
MPDHKIQMQDTGKPAHFIDILSTDADRLKHLLSLAGRLKAAHLAHKREPLAAGKTLAMIFEKPSLRTRVSFDVAMTQLGGSAIYISPNEIGLGSRESVPDVARVLSGMCDAIMARTFSHQTIIDLARHATIPIINGLSDHSHPCQAMADLLTIQEAFGSVEERTLAYIGDGNNVARSLLEACAVFKMRFAIATPPAYRLPEADFRAVQAAFPIECLVTDDPRVAVANADAIYTDTWVSMGQEAEKAQRLPVFRPYQINTELLSKAPKHAIVLHCLPAYRGVEITDDVIDGPQSRVFEEAHNRLHFQKALLADLLAGA